MSDKGDPSGGKAPGISGFPWTPNDLWDVTHLGTGVRQPTTGSMMKGMVDILGAGKGQDPLLLAALAAAKTASHLPEAVAPGMDRKTQFKALVLLAEAYPDAVETVGDWLGCDDRARTVALRYLQEHRLIEVTWSLKKAGARVPRQASITALGLDLLAGDGGTVAIFNAQNA